MANPLNSTNLTLSIDTYNRLKRIKEHNNWSFNQTLDKLCELEFQNNYVETIKEYVLITANTSRLFRVTFKKENIIVEYYTPDGYSNKIKDWNLDKRTTNKFFEFIREDYARCMLENLPIALEFKDFIIQKI
jgi:hypothetical protein